jgi:hypothetical protein
MIELNTTEEKALSLITPFLVSIQSFVDANICNGKKMPAANIYAEFTKTNPIGLSQDDFIKGFRAAVKVEKITGIVGAKRAGYKQIGDTSTSASNEDDEPEVSSLDPYIIHLQPWITQRITGEVRMTAATIYNKFKGERGCKLEEDEFVTEFRLAIKNKKITGLESAYRLGYKQAGIDPKPEIKEDSLVTKTGHEICEITIDNRRKLVAADKLNWTYMVRTDSGTWHVEGYYSSAYTMIKGMATKILDDELKGMDTFSLVDMSNKIEEAVNNITSLLNTAIQGCNIINSKTTVESIPEEIVEEDSE